MRAVWAALVATVLLAPLPRVAAQGRGAGAGQNAAPPPAAAQNAATPRAVAPIDLTGYWVSIVSEDWRWRMGVGQKGDFSYIPLSPEGRRVGNAWDPAADAAAGDQCKAYGAAAIMRVPAHLHITWDNDDTLKIEIDNGTQTRLLHFGGGAVAGDRTWQGYSVANWAGRGRGSDRGRGANVVSAPSGARNGELRVITTNMRAGYYFRHGVPYSDDTRMTEYFALIADGGEQYLTVTTIVEDPRYLAQQFVRSLHFRREPNGAKFKPTPCV